MLEKVQKVNKIKYQGNEPLKLWIVSGFRRSSRFVFMNHHFVFLYHALTNSCDIHIYITYK